MLISRPLKPVLYHGSPAKNGGLRYSALTEKSMKRLLHRCSAFRLSLKKRQSEYALRQKGKVAELALGYQGGTSALITMGALNMGIPESDLPDIVHRWRDANRRIRDLWYAVDNAAVQAVTNGGAVGVRNIIVSKEYNAALNTDSLTITLPSGRKLYYISPQIYENQWGSPSIAYMGMDQKTKKWKRLETYGGKLVENCVQAIARDCLAEQ